MMLRRKTDFETGTHTLCQLARSKYMPTCHKRHQKSHLIRKLTGKMPLPRLSPRTRTHTLREPAQSKCTSIFHKGHQRGHLSGEIYSKNVAV